MLVALVQSGVIYYVYKKPAKLQKIDLTKENIEELKKLLETIDVK